MSKRSQLRWTGLAPSARSSADVPKFFVVLVGCSVYVSATGVSVSHGRAAVVPVVEAGGPEVGTASCAITLYAYVVLGVSPASSKVVVPAGRSAATTASSRSTL